MTESVFGAAVVEEDAGYAGLLDGVPVRPVFVMGLHRSGTTFLLESLARVFPLATLTAFDVLTYPRLLSRYQAGLRRRDQVAFDAALASRGLADRQVDAIALSHETVEEYGWVLQRRAGDLRLSRRTQPAFDELCRKLMVLHPGDAGVVVKNPWDTGYAARIRRLYPDARFVFIARHPLRILHSQLRNALLFGGTEAEYLWMLLEGFPLGRAVIGAQRRLHRWVGEERYARIMIRGLMSDVRRELGRYRDAWTALPPEARIEVTYPELTSAPVDVLRRVAAFLDLEPSAPLATVEPRRRGGAVHPLVARHAPRFLAGLRKRGLLRDELDEV